MDIATLGLRVDSNGFVRAMGDVDRSAARATRSTTAAERAARMLRNTLAAMGGAIGVQQLVMYADTWNLIEGRLSLVTSGARNLGTVQNEVFAGANRARVGFEATSSLYTKLARNADTLGASQRDMLTVTETINKAFVVSGAAASEVDSSVRQLGQAFASGTLRGDELNSMLENAPRLAEAVAAGMGVTVGQLRALGREGKLTSKAVFDAIRGQASVIEEEFGRMPVTVGQSLTVLKNEVMRFIGMGDNATGMSKALADTVLLVARNLRTLFTTLAAGGAAWLVYTNAAKIAAFWTAAVAAAQTIAAYVSLAAQVRNAAAAMTLFGMATKGAVAFLAGPAGIAIALGLAIGLLVTYGQRAREAARANDEFAASLAGMSKMQVDVAEADLDRQIFEAERKLEQMRAAGRQFAEPATRGTGPVFGPSATPFVQQETAAYREQAQVVRDLFTRLSAVERHREALAELEIVPTAITPPAVATSQQQDMVRLAQQAAALARLEGDAQARLAIEYGATNKAIDARRELQGGMLASALAAIDAERRANLDALTRDVQRTNEDATREAQQQLEVAQAQGAAQERLAVEHAATNREIEARRNLQGALLDETLKVIAAERAAGAAALQSSAAREEREAGAERIAQAQREIDLVRARVPVFRTALDGTLQVERSTAEERVRINQEAERAIREANLRLGDSLLSGLLPGVLAAIDAERRLRIEALGVSDAMEKEAERLQRVAQVLEDFRGRVAATFTDLFEGVFTRGIDGFRQFFRSVHQMLARMVAEMLTRTVMLRVGNALAGSLAGVFGGLPGAAAQAPSPTALTMQGAGTTMMTAASTMHSAATIFASGVPGAPSAAAPQPVTLEGVNVSAQRSLAADVAKYMGPALAGFAVGRLVGGMTTNRAVGTGAGALSGAAAGAMAGSIVPGVGTLAGGILGGIAGAIGGLLGASRRREQAERRTADLLAQNNTRLLELKMSNETLSAAREQQGGAFAARLAGAMESGSLGDRTSLALGLAGGDSPILRDMERTYGMSFQQLAAIARETGIQLYDSAGKLVPGALRQLAEAIGYNIERMTQWGTSVDQQRARQEAYNDLFDVADNPAQKLGDAFDVLKQAAPALLEQMGLGNVDLSTEEGRALLLKGMQDIFRLIDANLLTPELLGAFTDKDALIDALRRAKAGLDAFKDVLGDVTTDFPLAMRLLLWEQEHGRGTRTGGAPAPSGPPAPPPASGPTVGHPNAPTSFTGTFHIAITPGRDDSGEAILRKIEDAAADRASRGGYTYLPRTVIEA